MTSSKKNKTTDTEHSAVMKRMTHAKLKYRVKLAKLPFEKKVDIVWKLQKIDASLDKAAGRKPKRVWDI